MPVRPRLNLDVYIDDQSLSCSGPHRSVVDSIVEGAKPLRGIVESCFGCSLALDKTAVVASSKSLGDEVSFEPAHLGGNSTSSA
eukprot:5936614-Pyramimonas_sp.AAC.1